jgi:alpha-tubulin suppressor-like RCC1 family protein
MASYRTDRLISPSGRLVLLLLCAFILLSALPAWAGMPQVSSGGYHSVTLKSDGTLWAWGDNIHGQLGDGTTVDKSTPTQIGIDNKWVSIATGYDHTVALKSDGTLWAWGYNYFGQVGDGTTVNKSTPTQIGSDNKWVYISAGAEHTVALKSDGTLWAWGRNSKGQLGIGNNTGPETCGSFACATAPTQIGTDTDWASIIAGGGHTVALKPDGTLWSWGYNGFGQLGDGTTVDKSTPTKIGVDNDWASVLRRR